MLVLVIISASAAYFSKRVLGAVLLPIFLELNLLSSYAMLWVYNDIVVYTPSLVIYGLVFRRFMSPATDSSKTKLSLGLIFAFFLATYSLAVTASIINQEIAEFFTRQLGTDELKDVFENVMPEMPNQWLVMLFFVGIVAPIVEEIIYRHMLLKPLRSYGDRQAVFITAVLFGAFHGNMTQLLYATVAGVLLGIIAVKANSVKPAIIIHVLINSFDIGRAYLIEMSENEQINISTQTLGRWIGIFFYVGILAFGLLLTTGQLRLKKINNINED
jgi:membrane protease YdiL (CAAX protease family)